MENLNCLSEDDLRAFIAQRTSHDSTTVYAVVALDARQARLEGRIKDALRHERRMQRIYDSLPLMSRW